MPLIHLYDRATIEASPTLPVDTQLHDLLAARVVHLSNQGLLDMSEIVVVDHDTVEAEIVAALGFSPLDGLTSARFGEPGFCTLLDYVTRVGPHYHEAIVTVGNAGFAFHLLVHDGADPRIVALLTQEAGA